MKTQLLSLLLSTLTTTVLGQVACVQDIHTTLAYLPALLPHATDQGNAGAPCPTIVAAGKTVQYFLADNSVGCCAETATAKVLGAKAAACCPCGALCTGFFPKVLDWTATNGRFLVAFLSGLCG
jgi:hypothetical protein